jgi:DNA-binding CsgD family transcriptional regulator
MRVLRCGGVESEVTLSYAVLHQLLHPVRGRVAQLPPAQAEALGGALGLGPGRGEDRFLVAVAVLTLLADLAADGGLLVLVDDAQWVDAPSLQALVFVARRLEAEGIVLLVAARNGSAGPLDGAGLPELALSGLAPRAARELLAGRWPGISLGVADAIVTRTAGNPLALLEVPSLLDAEQRAGRAPLPLLLPTGAEKVFADAVEGLPLPTRRVLLLAAADEEATLDVLVTASARLRHDLDALDAAERAGLVAVGEGRVSFRHPLIRSAVYHGATLSERRSAHLALAEAHPPERSAWHRAAAAVGTDADLAAELEGGAVSALRRAAPAAASLSFERSAASAQHGERGRRLLAAAQAAWAAGEPARSVGLLDRAEPVLDGAPARALAAHVRGSVELRCGTPDRAYEHLVQSARQTPEGHQRLESLVLAGEAASVSGDIARTVEVGRMAAEVTAPESPQDAVTVALLTGIADALSQGWDAAADRLRRVVDAGAGADEPTELLRAGRAALYLGDEVAARDLHARAVHRVRLLGAVSQLPTALDRLAFSDALAGRLADAAVGSDEGLRLADQMGGHEARAHHLVILALVAAWRGDEDACRRHADEAQALAVQRRLRLVAATASWALGLLELGLGRPGRAVDLLIPVAGTDTPLHSAVQVWAAPDLIEAAVRAGRPDPAHGAAQRYDRWARHSGNAWAVGVSVRGQALLGPPERAGELLHEALRRQAEGSRPLELARTHLVLGELLRRDRERLQARPHLRTALEVFERSGARPWAERAEAELRATGVSMDHRRAEAPVHRLTPQELHIARLAAGGASNPEIAAQLFLSRRTVEYHLRKVFAKLAIASRADLRRLEADW